MRLENLFAIANMAALLAWASLIFLPRWPRLLQLLLYGVVGALCTAYAAFIFAFFFRAEGGFGTLSAVKQLFASDPVALAGWLHYLAFDLFAGLWIVERFDAAGIWRPVQTPVLIATFLFGPLGLIIAYALLAMPRASATARI